MGTPRRHISGETSFLACCRSGGAWPLITWEWATRGPLRTALIGSWITRYLDAWFDIMGMTRNVTLVLHDWGSALGFSWAHRHPDRIKALVYMEAIVRPFLSWDEWPEATREFFKAQRTSEGEDLILEKNLFIEFLLPLRGISNDAIEVYRRHYRNPGPTRTPMSSGHGRCPSKGTRGTWFRSWTHMRTGSPRAGFRNCSSMAIQRGF
jgi:pimeloyl-ACP methyl ester carboxylesterase